MPYRLTKIYTRKGDEGYTTLGDNRLSKDDLLVEAVGSLDELNSSLGFVLSQGINNPSIVIFLTRVQHELFDMGGELHRPETMATTAEKVTALEQQLDQWNENLAPLTEFLLPRGDAATAACHLTRTICRRAERTMVHLHRQIPLQNTQIIRYLNRLSDVLFVAARVLLHESKGKEVLWEHEQK